jgi:hypothetical protein
MFRIICILFLLCAGCVRADSPLYFTSIPQLVHAPGAPKIVLITIDGVRWQDMFDAHEAIGTFKPTSRQLAPNIYKHFVDNGIAVGKNSHALVGGPVHVSLPGYLEIMRGYPSLDCLDNSCPQNIRPTLIDQFPNDAAVFAGWEPIAKVFDNSLAVVNIGRHIRNQQWKDLHLVETDSPDDFFDDSEYKSDVNTYFSALEYLKHNKQPSFLWVSFGDTDNWAHLGHMFFYWSYLNAADMFIKDAMLYTDPNTVYIICPDHGRSADFMNHGQEPESRRVWIMIGGAGIPKAGFVKYDSDVYLSNIYYTIMDIRGAMHSKHSLLNYSK